MALDEASHPFQNLRSLEIQATGIRTCPDVELGEECEDQCYLGQGSKDKVKDVIYRVNFPPR